MRRRVRRAIPLAVVLGGLVWSGCLARQPAPVSSPPAGAVPPHVRVFPGAPAGPGPAAKIVPAGGLARIEGLIFADRDGDARWTAPDLALGYRTVRLYRRGPVGLIDPERPLQTVAVGGDGRFAFEVPGPGVYLVAQERPPHGAADSLLAGACGPGAREVAWKDCLPAGARPPLACEPICWEVRVEECLVYPIWLARLWPLPLHPRGGDDDDMTPAPTPTPDPTDDPPPTPTPTPDPPPGCGSYRTVTLGGWGSTPAGDNPGTWLQTWFSQVYAVPPGLQVGSSLSLTFTTATAVGDFLRSTQPGAPGSLSQSSTDPTGNVGAGVFGKQVVTLRLNVDFSERDLLPGETTGDTPHLGDLVIATGAPGGLAFFPGLTVQQLETLAESVLGGATTPAALAASYPGASIAQLNDAVNRINVASEPAGPPPSFLVCPGS
ncbi:MAG: hypothetical protein VKP72_08130 [bacterium]|nr:hypothetical protein [bacterium]